MIVPGSANSLLLAQGASTGYNLTKSLRFRSSASAYLNRTNTTPTNANKWTWSGWVKRGALGTQSALFGAWKTANGVVQCYFQSNDTLRFYASDATQTTEVDYQTSAVYRDPSACYHIVIAFDNTGVTASTNIYVNGTQVTSFGTSTNTLAINSAVPFNVSGLAAYIGQARTTGNSAFGYFDGYQTEINFIDGQQLTPSSFGENNATTGVWQPKRYTGTYGTNGFYLPFTNTTSTTTLGYDFSGNSNNWTTNNFSLTAGSTYDSMTDVPTLTSANTANYAVLNPNATSPTNKPTVSNGNLKQVGNGGWMQGGVLATMGITSGKYYWETTVTALQTTNGYIFVGVAPGNYKIPSGNDGATTLPGQTPYYGACVFPRGASSTEFYANAAAAGGTNIYSGFGQTSVGDVIQVAFDADSGKIWFGRNNTWYNSGVPASGTNPTATLTTAGYTPFIPCNGTYDSTDGLAVNFGQQPFTYTPPTGFVALNTYNLPTSTIVKGNTVMDATTYTGTGASLSVTNAGFKPDLVWIKSRSAATDHKLTDSVRGTTKALISDTTGAETTDANGLTAFGTSGFTVGTDTVYNNNTATYVGWQWQAGQGTTSSNTNGSITSTVSVNATAGFSIVTYTGTQTAATIGHGLGVAPSMIIVRYTGASNWQVYHVSNGNTSTILLNSTAAVQSNIAFWNNTSPTSSVFSVGTSDETNHNGGTTVAYCWAEIAGFSKFGLYTGNNSSDGPFIYTGFRPKFILVKREGGVGDWVLWDSSRNTYNLVNDNLYPNLSNAEDTAGSVDFLSNGFKLRAGATNYNGNGYTYIYAAFAENPFKNALAR